MEPTEQVSPTHSFEDGNGSSFRNTVFFGMPKMGRAQKTSSPERFFLIHEYLDSFEKNVCLFYGETLAYDASL
jgi:hypothetical protein